MRRLMPFHRHLLVPETIQTSALDCGPASLKSLLEGFGIRANYDALRDACQTGIDGTSIDAIEQLANRLGLQAEQVMLPPEHILLPEAQALPALAVVRNAEGLTHFVVVWRHDCGLVQVMDLASGRRWATGAWFENWLYIHTLPVAASEWREWAGSPDVQQCLFRTLKDISIQNQAAQRLIEIALNDQSWRSLAALFAAIRLIKSLRRSAPRGNSISTTQLLEQLLYNSEGSTSHLIPPNYWPVTGLGCNGNEEEQLQFSGAVLVRIRGLRTGADAAGSQIDSPGCETLSPGAMSMVKQKAPGPARELWRLIHADGLLAPAVMVKSSVVSAAIVVGEALLFRSLLDIGAQLHLQGQRFGAVALLVSFLLLALLFSWSIAIEVLRLGRHLECRFRIALFEKLARLEDRYFRSRLISDLAERAHSLHALRRLPVIGSQLLGSSFQLVFTAIGIMCIAPRSTLLTLLTAALGVLLPILTQPALAERELRMRSHVGALGRFYLDAMLGLTAVRAHAAERSVRSAHEGLLFRWANAGIQLQHVAVLIDLFQFAAGFGLAIWLLLSGVAQSEHAGTLLLLIFWVLSLPAIGQSIAIAVRQYPAQRNVTLRILEPLTYADPDTTRRQEDNCDDLPSNRGIDAIFDQTSLTIAGTTILEEFSLQLQPGSHVAVVGPSGAGKSSLVGLLLGLSKPSTGRILIDGEPLQGARLARLHQVTAWVDPAVHLWNRSLADNLCYGAPPPDIEVVGHVVGAVELRELLENLPSGLQTPLGENGASVSGGEGQRIRLGRAMLRANARLVILDEPFTALDQARRRRFLLRARHLWRNATLIYITHDIFESLDFDRVLVIESGKIVEDGSPRQLVEDDASRFRSLQLLDAVVQEHFILDNSWRHLRLDSGELTDAEPQPSVTQISREYRAATDGKLERDLLNRVGISKTS